MRRITTIGPESSGKTTIAKAIADHFDEYFTPEYARIYLTLYGPEYTFEDLDIMAKGQLDLEQEYLSIAKKYLISDTNLLTYEIWSKYKYGKLSPFISKHLTSIDDNFYLLCAPDFAWEEDPLRENPEDRDEIFNLYEENLKSSQCHYIVLKGSHELRLEYVLEEIAKLPKLSFGDSI